MEFRAYRMRLKKDKIDDYIEIHKKEKIWKSIVDGLSRAKFTKMIILQFGQDILLFEEAEDLKKAYGYNNCDPESEKWDKMVSGWMEIYPEFDRIKGDINFEEIPVVFYYEGGKLLH
jgi:L-rhamnose mutarotase